MRLLKLYGKYKQRIEICRLDEKKIIKNII